MFRKQSRAQRKMNLKIQYHNTTELLLLLAEGMLLYMMYRIQICALETKRKICHLPVQCKLKFLHLPTMSNEISLFMYIELELDSTMSQSRIEF